MEKTEKIYISNYNTPWPLQPHPSPGPKNHLPSVPRLAFWQLSHHCDFGTNLIWNMTEDNTIKKFPTSPCRWDTTCSPAMMQDWGMLQSSRWIPLCSGPPVQPASAWAVHSSAQPPGPSPHWCPGTLDIWYQKGFFNRQGRTFVVDRTVVHRIILYLLAKDASTSHGPLRSLPSVVGLPWVTWQ